MREAPNPYAKRKRVTQRRRIKTRAEQGYVRGRVAKKGVAALRIRGMLMLCALMMGFSGIGVKLGHVALVPAQEPQASIRALPKAPIQRGNIYDANGELLATTLKVHSVYADPKRVLDAQEVVQQLNNVIPHLNTEKLAKQLSKKKRRFVWVRRHITPEQAFAINALGLPGVGFREEFVRMYPNRHLAAHVLGSVNVDGRGLAGIERSYNGKLAGGEDVYLTLDNRLQKQLTLSLHNTLEETSAKGAWGVVLDAKTGDVRAMASLPDYDPNTYGQATDAQKFNPITFGRYEMGSTFKLFTLAQGLHEGVVDLDTQIDCRYPIKIAGFTIKDYHAQKRIMTAQEVLRHSSNIGAAQIADAYGGDKQRGFFRELGLLEPLDVGLPELIEPNYPARWGRIHTITMSYGHGIAITPLQLVAAISAISTDGVYRKPRLLKHDVYEEPRQVLDMQTVADVKTLMRDVVQNGSGWRIRMKGMDVGGKTGTAEKVAASGGYSENKNLTSFVGAVPLENPELVVLVMVDEPGKGYETAGRAAAPAFKDFVQRVAPLLALAPQENIPTNVHVATGDAQHSAPKTIRKKLIPIEDAIRREIVPTVGGIDPVLEEDDKGGIKSNGPYAAIRASGAVTF